MNKKKPTDLSRIAHLLLAFDAREDGDAEKLLTLVGSLTDLLDKYDVVDLNLKDEAEQLMIEAVNIYMESDRNKFSLYRLDGAVRGLEVLKLSNPSYDGREYMENVTRQLLLILGVYQNMMNQEPLKAFERPLNALLEN